MSAKPEPATSHTTIFASLAEELERAGALCDRLEALISKLMSDADADHLEIAMREAQTLDVLTQHLAALAVFSRHLSEQVEADADYDLSGALSQIRLGDLAHRLGESVGLRPADRQTADSGELHLF